MKMHRTNRLKTKREGFVIPLVMSAVVLLLLIGGGLLSIGSNQRIRAVRNCSQIKARCAADAGVTEALFEMNRRLKLNPWDDSILPKASNQILSNTEATYSYTVTGDLLNGYTIESTGKCGISEKIIHCGLELEGPFEHAILTKKSLILKAGTLIQGYNSLDPWDTDIDIKVVTQSTAPQILVLHNGVGVDGDVAVGVGGNVNTVIKDLGASTQNRYALVQNLDLPIIPAPELPGKDKDIKVHGNIFKIAPKDSGQYNNIYVGHNDNSGVLEIEGGDVVLYVTGDISLGQDCEIVIKEGSSLTLYLDGDMVAGNNAGFNNEGSPSSLKIFGTSTDHQNLILKAKSETLGAIYAPNAAVAVYAQSDIRGSLIAESFELKAGGNFYYDKALSEVSIEDAIRFVITRWSEWDQ
jgi:hypothetical protein